MKKIKIGVVPYMNARPLACGLEGNEAVELHFDIPPTLADMLSRGMVDVALVPSIEYFSSASGGLRIIPEIAIASRGEVRSVKLLVRNNPIEKVALDIASNTSCVLSRIIMSEKYRITPALTSWNPSEERLDARADAFLIIGDNALKTTDAGYDTMDLGKEWEDMTHLPFVYAFWATKRETKVPGLIDILKEAKSKGLNKLDELAAVEAKRLGLTYEDCFVYLSKNICYDLGEKELAGLKRFYRYAVKLGIVKDGVDIEFYKD